MGKTRFILFALMFIFVLSGRQVSASTLVVTKTADTNDSACDSDCSLREAVVTANSTTAGDIIILPAGVYALTIPGIGEDTSLQGDLDTSVGGGNLTIQGAGAGVTVIDGSDSDRILQIQNNGTTVTVSGVTFRNGRVSGGSGGNIFMNGTNSALLVLSDCVVESGEASSGGGLHVNSRADITRTLFQGNSAVNGGAIGVNAGKSATCTNCTFFGNHAAFFGGAIQNNGSVLLTNVTIANNSTALTAGGIHNADGAVLDVANSIIVNNTAETSSPDCNSFVSLGFNLIGNTSGCVISGNSTGNITDVDAHLGPLAFNGGPTATLAPGANSPAVDTADQANCPVDDQRGMGRPQGGGCDMGAMERTCSVWKLHQPNSAATAEIVMDPASISTIYAGITDPDVGVLKSTDFGLTWEVIKNGLPTVANVTALAIDPNSRQILYAGLTGGNAVFKTTNGGVSWTPSNSGFSGFVGGIVVDPNNTSTIYIATHGPESVVKSTNSGASWNAANTGLPAGADVREIAVSRSNSNVYAASDAGIFLSTDSGATWTPKNNGFTETSMKSVAVDPGDALHVFASGSSEAAVSSDGGESWTLIPELANREVRRFAIDPSNTKIIYATTSFFGKLWRSLDGGNTWKPFTGGVSLLNGLSGMAISKAVSTPFAFLAGRGIIGLTEPAPYCEDFDDGEISDWTVNGPFDAAPGSLQGTFTKKSSAVSPSTPCVNCSVDVSFTMTTPGAQASIFAWYLDKKNQVELRAMEDKDTWLLIQKVAGKKIFKQKVSSPIDTNTVYRVTLSFSGSEFQIDANGSGLITAPTSVPPPPGSVGVQVKPTHGSPATVVYDDIIVF